MDPVRERGPEQHRAEICEARSWWAAGTRCATVFFYESRLPDLQIIGKTLDQVFDHVFADRTEDERAAIKQRFATEQAIAGAPRRIETICLDLIDHFTKFIAPNRFKAQVVATRGGSRPAAAIGVPRGKDSDRHDLANYVQYRPVWPRFL